LANIRLKFGILAAEIIPVGIDRERPITRRTERLIPRIVGRPLRILGLEMIRSNEAMGFAQIFRFGNDKSGR
jgi:hypothetical protein